MLYWNNIIDDVDKKQVQIPLINPNITLNENPTNLVTNCDNILPQQTINLPQEIINLPQENVNTYQNQINLPQANMLNQHNTQQELSQQIYPSTNNVDNLINMIKNKSQQAKLQHNEYGINKTSLYQNDLYNINNDYFKDFIIGMNNENGNFTRTNNSNKIYTKSLTKENNIFNINNVSSEHINNFYANALDKTSIYVLYDKGRFIFKDYNKRFIGSFSIVELIRYVIREYDENDFVIKSIFNIKDINIKTYNDSKKIIKKFVLIKMNNKVNCERELENNNIKVHTFKKSPFMGDLQMLIHLNKDIMNFEKHIAPFYPELCQQQFEKYKAIRLTINELICSMLSYTIKLITIVSSKINKEMNVANSVKLLKTKNMLHMYALQIITKLAIHTREVLVLITKEQNKLEHLLQDNSKLKKTINNKLMHNEQIINEQNNLLEKQINLSFKEINN